MKRWILCFIVMIVAISSTPIDSNGLVLPDYQKIPYRHLATIRESTGVVDYYGIISCAPQPQCIVIDSISVFKDLAGQPVRAEWSSSVDEENRIYDQKNGDWVFQAIEY